MSTHIHGLSGLLGRIADAAGVKAALALAQAMGGRELKLSDRPEAKLATIVGPDAAVAIVELLGAVKITVPMAHLRGQRGRREAAVRMLQSGAKISQVAETVDVHERTVYRLKGAKPADTTGFLFGDD